MYKLIVCTVLVYIGLLLPTTVIKAISAPFLTSPENNSTVSAAPTLNWETVIEATQYRVLVDNEETVSTPYIKNYLTTNTHYSPVLNPGKYFWRILAKDIENVWSIGS